MGKEVSFSTISVRNVIWWDWSLDVPRRNKKEGFRDPETYGKSYNQKLTKKQVRDRIC